MSIKQFKNGGLIPLAGLNSFTDMSDVDGLLDGKQNVLTFDDAPTDGSSNPVTSDGIYDALANLGAGLLSEVQNNMLSGKQDVLTFDSTPTEGSSNPVTSDGIKQAIDDAISSSGGGGGSGGSGSSVKLYDTFGQNTDGAINQKVVSDALDAKANQSALDALGTAISGKQDTLTFDSMPTEGSSNPVTSDGIKTALDSKQNALTFDDTPTEGSVNPVTSDGLSSVLGDIASALDAINNGIEIVVKDTSPYDILYSTQELSTADNNKIDLTLVSLSKPITNYKFVQGCFTLYNTANLLEATSPILVQLLKDKQAYQVFANASQGNNVKYSSDSAYITTGTVNTATRAITVMAPSFIQVSLKWSSENDIYIALQVSNWNMTKDADTFYLLGIK